MKAAGHFADVFGKEIAELEQGVVGRAIRDEVPRQEEAMQTVHTLLATNRLPGLGLLAEALDQVRVIRAGSDDNAIVSFNSSYDKLKSGIRRSAELDAALTPPRLLDLTTARDVLDRRWPFLQTEVDVTAALTAAATELDELLQRETFFKELASIDERTRALAKAYASRFDAAVAARRSAYQDAMATLHAAPEWGQLNEEQQRKVEAPLVGPAKIPPPERTPIPQIRAETEACASRLQAATAEMLRMVDGNRVVHVKVGAFFTGGIETPEQLDAAVQALRDECERLIGEGKKVWVQ